ncbi:unnamed protein product [Lupinus luteus]|uniref:GDSL esterase/lipase n=1 Tax=Lupinus luteus TaxID=3873 RepID=A0AAV1VRZ9_LUPLU
MAHEVEGAKKSYGVYNNNNNSLKLFVFGDSYVDTGNFQNSGTYKIPRGIIFPGYPAGRFGNGRILTDYLENSTITNPLEPCCALESVGYDCGKVNDKGEKKYTLCEKLELSFFWDNTHLSQKEKSTIMNPLEPFCALDSVGYDRGKVDDKGEKKYTLCEKSELSFFGTMLTLLRMFGILSSSSWNLL